MTHPLTGKRVLIVEDEPLIADDAGAVPARHANVHRVEKPVTPDVVRRVLEATLAARSKN